MTATSSSPTPSAARLARLQQCTDQARSIILSRQDPHTGLLPASTAITVHGDYTHAWVRDNVYSILAVWALELAHRDHDPATAAELRGRVEALMRGLLAAMLRQAHKVERFKHTQHPLDALHAKYSTRSGEPVVGDAEWGHLQIDATAIFLLQLAQMSASGLSIVRTPAEVAFVQNLVHYLARAYRTPDYGIWERGHKLNHGRAEINASSVGMARAALEAISGFELLPGLAPAILVQPDDVAHARATLAHLLPRESESKETDAALLSVLGFPAFAIEDAERRDATHARIIAKLQGRYGCKRFLRDGHQTVVEDHSRLHYEHGELQQFRRIESEWPLFYTYLLIDAQLRGDVAGAADYRQRLEDLMVERDGQRLLPELYYVPADCIEAERETPQSQPRVPNDNVPLVWAQSLYLVGVLLQDGLLRPEQIDPLGRHQVLRRTARPPVTVQLALLATDSLAQARMAAHGLPSQTLAEVQPLQVRYADELDAALSDLGRWDELSLSGRPRQRPGTLATSRVYLQRHGDEAEERCFVFLPPVLARQGFYLGLDNRLLVDEIHAELSYLRRHWRTRHGQPLLALLITQPMLDAPGADGLLQALRELVAAAAPGATPRSELPPLHVGPLAELLPRARRCRLDALPRLPDEPATPLDQSPAALAVLHWEEAATRPLSPVRAALLERELDDLALQRLLERSRNPYEQIEAIGLLAQRRGLDAPSRAGPSLRQLCEALYARARRERRWGLIRRAAGVLEVHDETLEDAVAQIVVRQKQISVGRAYDAQAIIAMPLGNAELFERLRRYGGNDARGRLLIEEIVLLLGMLIKADTALFKGTLTLRPWYLLLLITGALALEHGISQAEAFDHLLDCSPQALLARLREVIVREREMGRNLVRLQALQRHGQPGTLVQLQFTPESDPPLPEEVGTWLAWREHSGVLTRVPADFHERVWTLLRQVPGLVIGDQLDARNRLDSTLARADSTPGERGFALHIEDLLNKVAAPEYRQLNIEALLAISELLRANPALQLGSWLVLDVLIGIAVRLGWEQASAPVEAAAYNDQRARAWADFYASAPHRVANLIAAALVYLVEQGARSGEETPEPETAATEIDAAAPAAADNPAEAPAGSTPSIGPQ